MIGMRLVGGGSPILYLTQIHMAMRVLKSNIKDLKNKKIKVFSDNKNVQSVLQIGSRISELQEIACDINELCEKNGITVYPEWIPSADNQMADDLSRFGDCNDWSVSDSVFHDLDAKWGYIHSMDLLQITIRRVVILFKILGSGTARHKWFRPTVVR